MTRKKGQNSGSKRGGGDRKNASGSGGGGGNGNNVRGTSSSRGGRVDDRGHDRRRDGNTDRRRDWVNVQRTPSAPLLSIPKIKEAQQEMTMANFRSSELTYNGSDKIIFITNGDQIKTVWKKILKRDRALNHDDIRIFIGSALVATDCQSGYEVEEFVTELGNPESGLKRLREIVNFPLMSCDAGLNNKVLSFQHVILPLMGLLTRTAITECILEKYVHAIIMVVYNNLVSNIINETV